MGILRRYGWVRFAFARLSRYEQCHFKVGVDQWRRFLLCLDTRRAMLICPFDIPGGDVLMPGWKIVSHQVEGRNRSFLPLPHRIGTMVTVIATQLRSSILSVSLRPLQVGLEASEISWREPSRYSKQNVCIRNTTHQIQQAYCISTLSISYNKNRICSRNTTHQIQHIWYR
jgi:hypothetical protein